MSTTDPYAALADPVKPARQKDMRAYKRSDIESFAADEARAQGVDPTHIRALIRMESGGNAQAVSSANAQGVMQLIPSTFKEMGGTDPFDAHDNIRAGIKYYKQQLDRFKDPVLAAAAYNAGPQAVVDHKGVPPFKETQAYVKNFSRLTNSQQFQHPRRQLIGRSAGNADPYAALADPTPDPYAALVDAPPGPAPSATPKPQPAHVSAAAPGPDGPNLLQKAQGAVLAGGTNVVKGADAILGAPQRLVSGFLTGGVKHGFDVAFHPFNDAMQTANERATEQLPGIHQLAQLAGAGGEQAGRAVDQIARLVGHPVQSQRMLKNVATTLTAQLATDPLTIVPGINILARVAKARKIAEAIKEGTKVAGGEINAVNKFASSAARVHDATLGGMNKIRREMFGARPELDSVLTTTGKAARLSIEAKEEAPYFALLTKHEKLIEKGKVPPEVSQWAATKGVHIAEGSGEDIRKAMSQTYKTAVDKQTEDFLRTHGGWKKDAVQNVTTLTYAPPKYKLPSEGAAAVADSARGASKASVVFNPIPHGIKNVGELAFLAGGPEAFGSSMVHAFKGVNEAGKLRLKNLGLHVDYLSEHEGVIGKALDKATVVQQKGMERLEMAYRHTLLQQLDRPPLLGGMGASTSLADEYVKAQKVRDALGDYRNVSRFVAGLRAIGAPFVAFRLGIIPKAVGGALRNNPQRVAGIYRAENDINDERHHEGATSEYNFGDPLESAGRMAFKLDDFMKSPASVGPLGVLDGIAHHNEGVGQIAKMAAAQYVPGLQTGAQISGFLPAPLNQNAGFPYDKAPPGVTPMQEALASLFGEYYGFPTSTKRKIDIQRQMRR